MTTTHNLTREEADRRSRLLTVDSYRVAIDLTRGDTEFGSHTTIRFGCHRPGADTFVEIAADRITSATLNGEPLDTTGFRPDRGLSVPGLAADNTLVVDAVCPYATDGEGLHRLVDPADGSTYLYTHFEANNAQKMYACFDQPDLKATFTLSVTLPADWRAVSNMPQTAREVDDGVARVLFDELPRTSTYLTALCAGPLHHVTDEHDGIELGLYCRASMAEHLDAEELFTLTRTGLDHFHQHFGVRYPLPKYDQVAMPEYNSGATENFGCVVYAEPRYVFDSEPTDTALERRAYVIYHEMAHMWFGDLVTPKWWDETWLKESFASWAGQWVLDSATAFTNAWTSFRVGEKNAAFLADSRSTTHPIRTEVPDVKIGRSNFDTITYCKGAAVLKQLAELLGIEDFCRGLREYFTRHQWGVADFDDLRSALEQASGRRLDGWAEEWLNTTGFNTLEPRFTMDPATNCYTEFAIVQHGEPHRTHRISLGLFELRDGRLLRRDGVELTVSGPSTPVPELIGQPQPDVVLIDETDLSYVRIGFDDRSRDTVLANLAGFEKPLERAQCWSVAADLMQSGDLPVDSFVEMMVTALPHEEHNGTVNTVLAVSQHLVALHVPGHELPRIRERLADGCLAAARESEPGSGNQLTWATDFAHFAQRDDQLAVLRAWLSGTDLPTDLIVDATLRWSLLTGLAAAGRADRAELGAAMAADRTIQGRLRGLAAEAALPDLADKERAFRSLEDLALSNADQRAILAGFWRPEQYAVVQPFTTRLLRLIDRLWDEGRQERAAGASWSVSRTPPTQDTLDTLERWLAEPGHPPTLRRPVIEARDDLARALRTRR